MEFQNVIPNISRVQLKITHYTMSERNLNLNKNRESTDVNTRMIQKSDLFDKDLKAVIKMLQMNNYREA